MDDQTDPAPRGHFVHGDGNRAGRSREHLGLVRLLCVLDCGHRADHDDDPTCDHDDFDQYEHNVDIHHYHDKHHDDHHDDRAAVTYALHGATHGRPALRLLHGVVLVVKQPTLEYLIGLGFLATWRQLDRIESKLDRILTLENQEMADLTQITADVSANGDAVASAVQLLQNIKAALDAAGSDPTALAALSSSLEANTQALADAVVANTPAAP